MPRKKQEGGDTIESINERFDAVTNGAAQDDSLAERVKEAQAAAVSQEPQRQLTPIEMAQAARRAPGYIRAPLVYKVVGVGGPKGGEDVLGTASSKRGAFKLADTLRPAVGRHYDSIEIWKVKVL